MEDNLIKLLSTMSNEENDFDIELREGNKLTKSITEDEARSWRPIDDYSDLDYDFSNVRTLINHPEIPATLEE